MSHTPGPWRVAPRYASPYGHAIHGAVQSNGEANHVGNIYDLPDARLIAAAPDLLEALGDLAAMFPERETEDRPPYSEVIRRANIARAAIAKARGGAS